MSEYEGFGAKRRTKFGRTGFVLDGSVVYRLDRAGQGAAMLPSGALSIPNAFILPESCTCDRRSVREEETEDPWKVFCSAGGLLDIVRIVKASGNARRHAGIERTSMMPMQCYRNASLRLSPMQELKQPN